MTPSSDFPADPRPRDFLGRFVPHDPDTFETIEDAGYDEDGYDEDEDGLDEDDADDSW